MPIDLKMLGWCVLLGLGYVLIAAALGTQQRGLGWNVSSRDTEAAPLTGLAGRADRASGNFMETFAFLAAAVLAVVLAQRNNAHTLLGVEIYFWARVAYLPVYLAGIPYLRTLIWAASLWGILQVLEALL